MAGTGRKAWAADEILAAADLQSYIQDQVVFVYDSSTTRSSGILTPTEGMISYLKDTNALEMYDGSAWVNVLPNTGTAGTYTKVTTDVKGRVTAGTTLSASDIPSLDMSKVTSGNLDYSRVIVGAVNITDWVANNFSYKTIDASAVTSGVFNQARIPVLDQSQIPSLDSGKITSGILGIDRIPTIPSSKLGTGNWNMGSSTLTTNTVSALLVSSTNIAATQAVTCADFNASASVTATQSLYGPATYNQTNTGRAVYIASNGLFGVGSSSERFKENIDDAAIDADAVLNVRVRNFTYKPEFSDDQSVQVGVIAEELVALGLSEFVFFDEDGQADGVAYERLALALIPVLQRQQSQLELLADRVARLEK